MLNNIPVRFFIFDFCEDEQEFDIVEVEEAEFLSFEGEISYERNNMFLNGCNQICLTKGLPKG